MKVGDENETKKRTEKFIPNYVFIFSFSKLVHPKKQIWM